MTDSTSGPAARDVLDDLMARVGVDGLVAALRMPGLLAAVDQHAAAIRTSLREAGRDVDLHSLAAYARAVLAAMQRTGRILTDPARVAWQRADWHLLRLVAVCALADARGCL